ncbi:thioredoxin-like protein [Crucibulum laeve]|uniref:Thioredoxin-like protein n=1 Tax=Crucibulum laeve TaxID=68775 RepID=A0A5C3M843_9AGAR|nr:thioredoxin-like protein [Crucibulum laeve]
MFNSFKRRLPEISIYHHASSPPSAKALNLLRSSLSSAYPPNTTAVAPLEFQLDVIESPPTADQMRTILSYLPSKAISPSTAFLSAHPSAPPMGERSEDLSAIAELGQKNPLALKWPIVVDWADGKASIGDPEGVKSMLELLRKRRDGEVQNDQIEQPKGWFT